MLKRDRVPESNGKLPYLFIPSKTVTLVPEFAVEDLPFSRTATLVPQFAVCNVSWTQLALHIYVPHILFQIARLILHVAVKFVIIFLLSVIAVYFRAVLLAARIVENLAFSNFQ